MKNKIKTGRLTWLMIISALVVVAGFTAHYFLQKPSNGFEIEEVLWVKKDGIFHPPGSQISRATINLLDPEYIEFDEMTFSGPMLLFFDNIADAQTSYSSTPLVVLLPYEP